MLCISTSECVHMVENNEKRLKMTKKVVIFIVFDHVNTCISMRSLVEINNK